MSVETIRYAPVERQPALPYLQVILDTVRYTGYVGDHGHAAHVIHCTMGLTDSPHTHVLSSLRTPQYVPHAFDWAN